MNSYSIRHYAQAAILINEIYIHIDFKMYRLQMFANYHEANISENDSDTTQTVSTISGKRELRVAFLI